jgi:O-antigen ligase
MRRGGRPSALAARGDRAASLREKPASEGVPLGRPDGTPLWTVGFVALLMYIFVIHSYKLPLGTTSMVVGLAAVLLGGSQIRLPPGWLWFFALVAWGAIGYPMSDYPDSIPDRLLDAAKLLGVMLVAANAASSSRQIRVAIVFWLAIFALYPIRGLLFNFVFGIGEFGRYAWNFVFSNPNEFAGYTLLPLGICVAIARSEFPKWVRQASQIGVAVLTVAIFLTQSRGGFLALAAFGLIVLGMERRRFRTVAIVGVLAGIVVVTAPSDVWTRIAGIGKLSSTETIDEADPEGSAASRYAIWGVAWSVFKDHQVTGVGFGIYDEAHADYALKSGSPRMASIRGLRDAHSAYLRVLAESGIVGFICFIGFLWSTFAYLFRTIRLLKPVDEVRARHIQVLAACWAAYWIASLFAGLNRVAFPYLFAGLAYSLSEDYLRSLALESSRALAGGAAAIRGPTPGPKRISRLGRAGPGGR